MENREFNVGRFERIREKDDTGIDNRRKGVNVKILDGECKGECV